MLSIKNLNVSIENTNILNGLNLDVKEGEIHAIMGPNGSGKSTLSATLAGRKEYKINRGEITFNNKNLLELSPEERAGEGVFLAFQYPVEIPGVSNQFFLQTSVNSIRKYRNQQPLDRFDFKDFIKDKIELLDMPK
ncbi:MAG: ATP-binding cassette domain-containing protein, partial [Arsenophonus sp. ER-LPS3-MAG3]